jgi:hypothetical protein
MLTDCKMAGYFYCDTRKDTQYCCQYSCDHSFYNRCDVPKYMPTSTVKLIIIIFCIIFLGYFLTWVIYRILKCCITFN